MEEEWYKMGERQGWKEGRKKKDTRRRTEKVRRRMFAEKGCEKKDVRRRVEEG